jgi:hypothetical protein
VYPEVGSDGRAAVTPAAVTVADWPSGAPDQPWLRRRPAPTLRTRRSPAAVGRGRRACLRRRHPPTTTSSWVNGPRNCTREHTFGAGLFGTHQPEQAEYEAPMRPFFAVPSLQEWLGQAMRPARFERAYSVCDLGHGPSDTRRCEPLAGSSVNQTRAKRPQPRSQSDSGTVRAAETSSGPLSQRMKRGAWPRSHATCSSAWTVWSAPNRLATGVARASRVCSSVMVRIRTGLPSWVDGRLRSRVPVPEQAGRRSGRAERFGNRVQQCSQLRRSVLGTLNATSADPKGAGCH